MASSPPLSELQGWLTKLWTTPEGVDAALASAEGRRAVGFIKDAPPLSPRDRLAVYYDAYFSRLLESLGADFSATKRALGEENFRRLIAEYLASHQSDSPNISDVGGRLPEFAKAHALSKRFPYLSDLCRLEWEILRALFTDRLPALAPSVFSRLSPADWENAVLVLDPTVRLLEVSWPVDRLWAQRHKPAKAARCLWRTPRPTNLVIWRDDEWVRVVGLDPKAFATLQRLLRGETLLRACEQSGAKPEEVQAWFAAWACDGLIKGVTNCVRTQ